MSRPGNQVEDRPVPLRGCAAVLMQRAGAVRGFGLTSLRCFTRPLSLGLTGLALALILWGLAYRLSLYHPHQNHHARIAVAKLWIAPRESFFALNKQTSSTLQHSPYTQFGPVTGVWLSVFNRAFAITTSAPPPHSRLDSPPAKLRSPPQAL